MNPKTNQRIDSQRLWDSLMEMARIGATPKGGVRRLALGDQDRQLVSYSGMVRERRVERPH